MTSATVAFDRARSQGRAALVGYLPAGFPDVEGSIAAMRTLVEAGCDVIEIGLPYSDPVMDGPVIQAAAQQALEAGVRTADVLRVVEAVAATGTPALVMTYWNPVERYGVARFARDLAAAVNSLLEDPGRVEQMGRRSRERVERLFSWTSVARRTLDFYAELVGGHPGQAPPLLS